MSLISNNNRRPTWKLVWKALKADKFRTVCLLGTICICTFIMAFLPCFNTLDYLNLYKEFKEQEHAVVTSLSDGTVSSLARDPHFEKAVLKKYGDFGRLDGAYARPVYQETPTGALPEYPLISGSLPESPEDILLDNILAQKLHVSAGADLAFQSSDETIKLHVTGIVQAPSGTSIPCFYVSSSLAETSPVFAGKGFQLDLWLKQEYLAKGFDEAASVLYETGQQYGIPESRLLLNYYALDSNPLSLPIVLSYVFLDFLVLVIGLLVIYSIFSLSVMTRIQTFGQMQTLGMTARQIRRMVNQESSLLCILGSIGGILPGLLLAAAAAHRWSLPYMAGTGAVVFACTYLFLMLFLRKPARLASQITPWEALHYQEAPLPAFQGKLSCRSLGRMRAEKDRKKLLFARLSIIAGGICFILTATYTMVWKSEYRVRSGYFQDSDYILAYNSDYLYSSDTEQIEYQKSDILNDAFLEKLRAFSDVEKVFPVREESVSLLTGHGLEPTTLIGVDEEIFSLLQPYLEDRDLTYEELVQSRGILYNPLYEEGAPAKQGEFFLNYYNGSRYQDITLPCTGTVDPAFSHAYPPLNASLLVPAPLLEEMYPGISTISTVYITTKDHKVSPELEQYLEEFTRKCPLIQTTSFQDYQQELDRQNRLLLFLFSGGTAIVILFSILNLFNTTLNRMAGQNRELALYEAVGMTRKEIQRMLLWEGLYQSRVPLAASWILGTGISLLFYQFLVASAQLLPYRFPVVPLLLWTVFVLALHWGISLLCFRRFTRGSLMERLKRPG